MGKRTNGVTKTMIFLKTDIMLKLLNVEEITSRPSTFDRFLADQMNMRFTSFMETLADSMAMDRKDVFEVARRILGNGGVSQPGQLTVMSYPDDLFECARQSRIYPCLHNDNALHMAVRKLQDWKKCNE